MSGLLHKSGLSHNVSYLDMFPLFSAGNYGNFIPFDLAVITLLITYVPLRKSMVDSPGQLPQ